MSEPPSVQPLDVPTSDPSVVGAGAPEGSAGERIAEPAPRARLRRAWDAISLVLFVGLAVLMWPVALGGSTGYTVVSGKSMEPTYHTGDLVITRKADPVVGDVIVYRVPEGDDGAGQHVIHRVIGGDGEAGFVTLGDNKPSADPWHPRTGDVVGVVALELPQAGRAMKLVFSVYGLAAFGGIVLTWVLWPRADEEDAEDGPHDERDDEHRGDGEVVVAGTGTVDLASSPTTVDLRHDATR